MHTVICIDQIRNYYIVATLVQFRVHKHLCTGVKVMHKMICINQYTGGSAAHSVICIDLCRIVCHIVATLFYLHLTQSQGNIWWCTGAMVMIIVICTFKVNGYHAAAAAFIWFSLIHITNGVL